MKLILFGGHCESNLTTDKLSLSLTEKRSPRVTFIPSCSYDSEVDFNYFVQSMRLAGFEKFIHFPIDTFYDSVLEREAFKSDLIHLGGGNTYYFLKYLRKKKMISKLKKFVKQGGVLTGLSAGAILLTPNILTASFPDFDRDENDEGIKNFSALNLVNFEFFPHYKNSNRYDTEILKYSKKINHPLFACPDGSSIIHETNSLKFVGKSYCFFKGKKVCLSNQLIKKAS